MFKGGEFVRLKADHPDYGLQAGDCGCVWGVYNCQVFDLPPVVYEAEFHSTCNSDANMMFNEDQVELIEDVEQTPHREWLLMTRRLFDEAEQRLRIQRQD